MGAFLLAKQHTTGFNFVRAMKVFDTMGLIFPTEINFGDWKIWSWKKIRSEENNYVIRDKAVLVCVGTPIYKNSHNFSESLELIMNDLQHDSFRFNNIRGSYTLVYSADGNKPKLFTDQAGISNIYFDNTAEVFSSSFLAMIFGMQKKVTLNKFAATEVITSGRLIGPDTLFNEISRVEISLMNKIGEIEVVTDKDLLNFPVTHPSTFDESVNEQIEAINNYFSDIKYFADNYGVDSGLTAGHDSRMLLIEAGKYFKNFQVHSFWRKSKDIELILAEKVAEKAGIPLKVVEGKHQLDKTSEQLEDTLKKSLYFYDGHIRMHCFLMEDYHTVEHRTAILGDKKLGMNGIGGEQYRNEWHMEMPKWSLKYFTRHALAYQLTGQCFTEHAFEDKYFEYLQKKLLKKLGLDINTKAISKLYVQKYYNEIYVSSLMGVRTNAENTLGHFITPFIDRQLTRASYTALPHHGISFGFQQAMIRKMDPGLASVQSGYGYSFTEGEPFKKKLKYLVKEFTPTSIYQRRLNTRFNAAGNNDFRQFMNKYPVFNESVQIIRQFQLPIDEKKITSRPDNMPIYLSLAYFLLHLSKEGRLEIG